MNVQLSTKRSTARAFLSLFAGLALTVLHAQQITVTGRVTDDKGEALPGVNIILKGSATGQVTDVNGRYGIGVPGTDGVLIFSFVGYIPQEISVGNRTTIDVELAQDNKALEEVVVVGYGTQKRVNLTGAVATISGKELQQTPTNNLTNAIGGRLPGVIAVQGNGRPGLGSSIQIRGASTLNSNSPLVVVDGIVRTDGFGNLDPNEVESISVLKDASSAAVYGARAANGVILITTKRGVTGKPTVTYSGMVGTQQPTLYPKLMSAYDYAKVRNQALLNQGYNPNNPSQASLFYSDADIEGFKTGGTDWYKETFKENSLLTQHNLSVNGGTEAIRYFMSMGYMAQDAMYDNFNFRRVNLRSNVDAKITESLTIGLNLEARHELYNYPGWDANAIFQRVINQSPLLQSYHPSGRPFNTNAEHPVEMIRTSGYNKNPYNIFQGALSFRQKLSFLTEGLSLRGNAAYYKQNRFNKIFVTPYSMYDEDAGGNVTNVKVVGSQTYLSELFHELNNVTLNLSLNYDNTFGRHDVGGLLLYEQFSSTGNTFTARKQDFATNIKDEFFASGPTNQTITGNGIIDDLRRSVVGRFNYAFDSRYLLEATFRYDGSYRFPKSQRFGFFPAFSAGWRVSEEAFFRNSGLSRHVDNLKIRVSKGLIGNDRVNPFQFTDTYGITTNIGPVIDNQSQSFVAYGVYPNPNITWEKQENNNIGLEASFLNSKLGLEFDYFFRTTKDILWSRDRSVPETFGRSLPNENYAEVKSRGFEWTLTHQNKVNSFGYNLRLIGSFATNKVTRIDDPSNALDYQIQLGRPMGFRAGYESLGLFQSQEEATAWYGGTQFGQKSLPGDIKYQDVNGDGAITLQDQKILTNYNETPRIVYGLAGGWDWKRFDFNFLLQGAAQRTLFISGDGGRVMYSGGFRNNFDFLKDSWSPDNPDAKYPLPWINARTVNNQNSNLWLRNAGYLRLKSVDIGYSLNPEWLKRINIQRLRVYVSGFNLLTVSPMKEFDPEAETGTGYYYPQQRNLNVGVNLSF